jgi:hypothetical protein
MTTPEIERFNNAVEAADNALEYLHDTRGPEALRKILLGRMLWKQARELFEAGQVLGYFNREPAN